MEPDTTKTIPIQVSISDITVTENEASNSPVINLKVTLRNTSDKAISFLRWSSPFDQRAVAMGIYQFKSLSTGELAPCLNVKIGRKMPRSGIFEDKDMIYIEANDEILKDVEVKPPEVVLVRGEKYAVKTNGRWMHVIYGKQGDAHTTDDDVLRGEFGSEEVEIEIPK